MNQYQHIIVGLDLTDESKAVLAKAVMIAESFNAEITVAHVLEPLAFAYGGDMPIDLTEAQAAMETQAQQRLHTLCDEFNIEGFRQIVTLGQASSELHELAKDKGADLIIVGSHGKHWFATLFGSTAKGVVSGAECDVLTVRV